MRSIQDVGIEILKDNPAKFYVFCGTEYGIKCRYIEHLKEFYQGRYYEYDTVDSVLKKMQKKQLIPLEDSLYVVRYDTDFIDSLDKDTSKQIDKTDIKGTVVCIYEDTKQEDKLDKYLSKYSVSIDDVDLKFIIKYLKEDYPELSDRLIKLAARIGNNYGQARQVAFSMSQVSERDFDLLSDEEILSLFGVKPVSNSEMIEQAVASKNFSWLCKLIPSTETNYDSYVYTIMNTMLELEKVNCARYTDSPLKEYKTQWPKTEIYNMYCHCYEVLMTMRSTSVNQYNMIIYLIALLKFDHIPSVYGLSQMS